MTFIVHAHSQDKIRFNRLTVRDGLSQNSIMCIFQDKQGFMWFGTQDGLNRYDGYTFTVFKHDILNPLSLTDNFVTSIYEDDKGRLWVGTQNGFHRFNRHTEYFEPIHRDSLDFKHARGVSVLAHYVDKTGTEWSASSTGGLARRELSGLTHTYTHNPSDQNSISGNGVVSIYEDRSGTIWVSTRTGLNRFNRKTETFVSFIHDEAKPNSLSDSWTWPIFEDSRGTLWVGTARGGLNRFDPTVRGFVHYKNQPTDPQSLSDNFVFSLYEDRSGVMWIGTNNGLSYFHPASQAFGLYNNDPQNAQSLSNNYVSSILVDKDGIAWIGTRDGLNRFNPMTRTFTPWRNDPKNPQSISDNSIQSLLEDRTGVLWVGTYGNGLNRFDKNKSSFKRYANNPKDPTSLSNNVVYSLLEDRDGTLWIGTYHGGLNRFDRRTESFAHYKASDSVPGSISSNGVWCLYEDRSGTLWVGTYTGGLNRFDKKRETFSHFKNDSLNNKTISDDNVLSIYEDRTGTLWVGTFGGLNRFDKTSETFKRYREKDGLPNDYIFGILEDRSGNLWLSTNKGLSRFDPKTERFRNYDFSDGLQSNEFNQNAFAKNEITGEMFFGGINGFNKFQPDEIRDNPFLPPVMLSSFFRYNTDDEEGTPIIERGISEKEHIELTYKDNIATVEFAALNYYNTFKNQYAYKLEGFSENWIQLGNERQTTFTNLDAGEYTLRVKGSNNDGVWNETGTALRLTVTPPWWKTKFAYATYALIIFGLLYGLRQFEINRREQKAQVRESELRAKAAEAEKRTLQIENDRKTQELEEARQLQLSMLPKSVPQLPHLEIAVFMRTATEVGGDYYDFQLQSDGTLNIACGDATGHGMQAGTVVTLMKGLFTSDASRLELRTFFNHCSKAIKDIKLGRLMMAFTMLKIDKHKITFATAGMPPVFIHRGERGTLDEILLKGMPLGAMKNFPYVIHEEELRSGDTVLLLTDGLPEQKNATGEMFDYARLQETLRQIVHESPQQIIDHLARSCDDWMNGAVQEDDITLMALRMHA